ncbi:MAG: hypothetical protein HN489_03355 [Opitutae bacterium]|mgnify:FL=1|uniref:hypothetical protein n=1 Tax=Candidatus Seribacter sulfatis TaxID=3381756 RepID=UPI0029E987F7|nr:hypothetical protein [Opitutae bacterium]MBT7406497.1 hypothetical protein [Opitutae bacterium]
MAHNSKTEDTMKDVISQVHEWIKLVSQVGIGLIALGIVVEIVFGKGAIFGASVVQNLSQIVAEIGGENGFVGLVAILIILAIFQRNK